MTQNHEDWVRGQEDFKINLEQMQQLQPHNANGKAEFQSIADVNNSASAFQIEIQKEIAQFHESVPSVSFDIKSWETLTQAHGFGKYANNEKLDDKNVELSQTKNEEEMQKLLDLENENAGSKNSSSQIFSTSNEEDQHYMNALGEHTDSYRNEKTIGDCEKPNLGKQGSE